MKKYIGIILTSSLAIPSAYSLTLTSPAFKNNSSIPYKYGYCQPDGKGKIKASDDISPPLKWAGAPKKTKSFVLTFSDSDIPNSPYFNVPGKTIKKSTPRITGYHWVVINIPKDIRSILEGAGSQKFISSGKKPGKTKYGVMGKNIYSDAFSSPMGKRVEFGDTSKYKKGSVYGKYDGPCAPWNDDLIHEYVFNLYALNIAQMHNLPESGDFTGEEVIKQMKGHILAQARLAGKFITNKKYLEHHYKQNKLFKILEWKI